jgi:hypothetical protein
MCECVRITQLIDGIEYTVDANAVGFQDGKPSYNWQINGQVYWMAWSSLSNNWTVFFNSPYYPNDVYAEFFNFEGDCPPDGFWSTKPDRRLSTKPCTLDTCDCGIHIVLTNGAGVEYEFDVLASGGIINNHDVYQWSADVGYGPDTFTIRFDDPSWWMDSAIFGDRVAYLKGDTHCPLGLWTEKSFFIKRLEIFGIACNSCGIEDRTLRSYPSVKLPESYEEEDRGMKGCCCEYLVLGDPSGDSWKNDITSAWIKMATQNDYVDFYLYKDENGVNYQCVKQQMPKDPLAYYTTVSWIDVLNSDGVGCYELRIKFSIAGVTGYVVWGMYNLQPYSIQNAIGTARIRAIFNGKQESEGIDFTDSDVVSTLRFSGYIGNRQPNTEIDNIIYSNREMKRVIRENLNSYEIITDPVDECYTKPLLEVFLLSENELFISDYNVHNHSYRYNDIPVILQESAEVEYYDFSRRAKVTAIVGDKFKNKRTYY